MFEYGPQKFIGWKLGPHCGDGEMVGLFGSWASCEVARSLMVLSYRRIDIVLVGTWLGQENMAIEE